MNAFELHRPDTTPTGVFACGVCGNLTKSKHVADACCAPRKCDQCDSLVIEKHYTVCSSCRAENEIKREAERFSAAKKITEWDGWIYCESFSSHNEGYFESVAALHEYIEDETPDDDELETLTVEEIADLPQLPTYVWTCSEIRFAQITVEQIVDLIADCGDAYDDFEGRDLHGLEELGKAIEAFNAANYSFVSYQPNMSVALLLTKPTDH